MGIYTNGDVYGIRIAKINNDDETVIFERKDVGRETLQEANMLYTMLVDTHNLLFFSYNEFSTTYGEGVYKSWSRISLDTFLDIITPSKKDK